MANNNKRWMHTEVKEHDLKEAIMNAVKSRGLYCEPSSMDADWYHIAVYCTNEEAAELNTVIDTL